jgi:adenosylhomocysteine nucleosidase
MADGLVGADGSRLAIDLKVDPTSLERTPGVHVGRLLTVDEIVRLPHEKRALGEKHGALAVDMESCAVAEVCRRHRVRFLAVRIISDAVDDELPPDVRGLVKQTTRTARLGAAVGAVFRRPSSVKDMWKLREDALVASDRLARFLASTIEQLAVASPDGDEQ